MLTIVGVIIIALLAFSALATLMGTLFSIDFFHGSYSFVWVTLAVFLFGRVLWAILGAVTGKPFVLNGYFA